MFPSCPLLYLLGILLVLSVISVIVLILCQKRKTTSQKALFGMGYTMLLLCFFSIISSGLAYCFARSIPSNLTNNFISAFSVLFALISTFFSLCFSYISAAENGDNKQQQTSQYTALINKLDNIETKLATLEANIPQRQETIPAPKHCLTSRLLHCLCGK